MKRYFRYDIERYKKRLIVRFALVGTLFLLFLLWNYFQIPEPDKKEFLSIFLPASILLGFFLYRNFQKQLELLGSISLEVSDKTIKQYHRNQESEVYDLSGLQKIYIDEYKSFPRVILEWEDKAVSFVNLEHSDIFTETIEAIAGIRRQEFQSQNELISIQAMYYLIPSIVYGVLILIFGKNTYPYLNMETFLLFLNANLIIYVLYGTGSTDTKYAGVYESRRKILFVLLILFLFQVLLHFSSSLGLPWNGYSSAYLVQGV